MPPSYEEVRELREHLATIYNDRHRDLRKLRDYWHGRYWTLSEGENTPLQSVFRDVKSPESDFGPDVKLVHNILQMVCVKYQTFLSTMPQIRMYVDQPASDLKRQQSRTKERYLYGLWSENDANRKLNNVAWYLPLMGHGYIGIFPDFDRGIPKMLVRTPEYAYPIPGFDKREEATIFHWEVEERWVKRTFPKYTGRQTSPRSRQQTSMVKIMEYSDDTCFYRWADEQLLNGVEHNLGFNLFQSVKFIDVPDEVFGHGAVEQIVNMNEMTNAMMSLLFQVAIDYAFPALVLTDPSKAPETIAKGPGAVIPLNQGGKAEYLHPPVQALGMQQAFVERAEFNIKQGSGMPDVNFGVSPATSIVTGKAIDELQGAGTGSTIEMVQGNGIGPALVQWNEKAIVMGQRMFRDKPMRLFGYETPGVTEINPRSFALVVKGSQLVGSTRNEVVFNPAMSSHDKLVMNLQAMGAGLVSKEHSRNQMGIPDSEAMDTEIMEERIKDAVLEAILVGLQQEPTPENAAAADAQATAYLEGTPPVVDHTPHPLLQIGATGGPGAGAPPAASPSGGAAPPPALPASAPPSNPGLSGSSTLPNAGNPASLPQQAPDATGQATATLHLNDVIGMLEGVQFQGRVFLVGEIVARGQTDHEVEVAVTDPADRQLIVQQVPQLNGRVIIHVIQTPEPREKFVEVTPAAQQVPVGAAA